MDLPQQGGKWEEDTSVNQRGGKRRQHRKVGRTDEESSSNRPKLAVFVLALHGTPVTKSMLYLCDNQALLKAVKRWAGEGGKATLVGEPDADTKNEKRRKKRKKK